MSARIFRFDGWTLNLQSGELERDGTRTRLQEHPLNVLATLLETPGDVVTREQLIARLWPGSVVDFDTGLNTAVRKLRAALGDTADTPRYIETLPRRGYRFIAPVGGEEAQATAQAMSPVLAPPVTEAVPDTQRVPHAVPDSGRDPHAAPIPGSAQPWARTGWGKVVLPLVVLVALAAWALNAGWLRSSGEGVAIAPAAAGVFKPPRQSIAVLPLLNMSGDPSQDYFSDGLSEELLNVLSQDGDLHVAARTSSFFFKGKPTDLAAVARRLNVATVLEGSVRRSGDTVRITVQLIDTASGYHLWSQNYDRNLGDVLAVQSEIAGAVANTLKSKLTERGGLAPDQGGTHDPLALDAYLRGQKLAYATLRSGEEARQTIAAYSEAIRIDPKFALAFVGRAKTYIEYGSYFLNEATPAVFTIAQADALRAIELAPDLGAAHAVLAETYDFGFLDYRKAAASFARAFALSPGDTRVLLPYARFIGSMGHADIALTAARRAVELDPLNVLAYRALGGALEDARRFPEAIAAFDQAISLNPSHATQAYQRRGRLYYLLGDYEKAKESCLAEPDPYHRMQCLPLVYERLGQRQQAEAALAVAMEQAGDYSAYQYAQIYAQWGEADKAVTWLETAKRIRDPGLECTRTDAFLEPLHGNPRFEALVRSLDYPP